MSSVCKAREMLANNQCFGKVCEREGSDCSPVQRHASAGSQNAKMFSTDAVSMYVESICCKYDVGRMTVCISTRSTRLSAREAALPVVLLEESHQLVGLFVHEGTLDGPVCCSNSAALDWRRKTVMPTRSSCFSVPRLTRTRPRTTAAPPCPWRRKTVMPMRSSCFSVPRLTQVKAHRRGLLFA